MCGITAIEDADVWIPSRCGEHGISNGRRGAGVVVYTDAAYSPDPVAVTLAPAIMGEEFLLRMRTEHNDEGDTVTVTLVTLGEASLFTMAAAPVPPLVCLTVRRRISALFAPFTTPLAGGGPQLVPPPSILPVITVVSSLDPSISM